MVETCGESDSYRLACKELRAKKIFMLLRRFLPDGTFEDWSLDELVIEPVNPYQPLTAEDVALPAPRDSEFEWLSSIP